MAPLEWQSVIRHSLGSNIQHPPSTQMQNWCLSSSRSKRLWWLSLPHGLRGGLPRTALGLHWWFSCQPLSCTVLSSWTIKRGAAGLNLHYLLEWPLCLKGTWGCLSPPCHWSTRPQNQIPQIQFIVQLFFKEGAHLYYQSHCGDIGKSKEILLCQVNFELVKELRTF